MNTDKKPIFLLWWLWMCLIQPAYYNAVFNRFRRTPINVEAANIANWEAIKFFFKVVLGFVIIYIALKNPLLFFLVIFIPPIIGMTVLILPFISPLIVVIYGMLLAMNIGQVIKSERAKYTYELIAATPTGALFSNWLMACGVVYRGQAFNWVKMLVTFVMWLPVLFLVVIGGIILLFFRTPPVLLTTIHIILNMALVMAALYLSYMQSILVGMLLGLLVPAADLSADEVRFVTIFGYLALQSASYLGIAALIALLHFAFHGQSIWLNWLLPIAYFGILLIVLELVVRWLFRLLVYRLNAAPEDLLINANND